MADQRYRPDKIVLSVDGRPLKGLASGTFVEISFNSDKYSRTIGSRGRVNTVVNLDDSGDITVTLQQNSPSVSFLDDLWLNDTVVPATVKDKNDGPSKDQGFKGERCNVERPDYARGDDIETKEYVLKAQRLRPLHVNKA